MDNQLVFVTNGTVPVTSSRLIADYFDKRHSDVTKTIDDLISDMREVEETASNQDTRKNSVINRTISDFFVKDHYLDDRGRKRRQYLLTQDGFTLAVMGFTGKKALKVKLAFINQFNQMKAELERLRTTADDQSYFEKQRIKYLEYKPSYHNSMNAIKLLIDYAVKYFNADKRELDEYFYRTCNGSINRALNIPKGHRPEVDPETAVHMKLLHRRVNDIIIDNINQRVNPYIIIDRVVSAIADYADTVIDYRPPKLILTIQQGE